MVNGIGDLYELLQVQPRAHQDVIHAAYRALARRYHPDVSTNPQATRAMRQINAAYAVLRDTHKRARYDAHRVHSSRATADRPLRPYVPPDPTGHEKSPAPAPRPMGWRRVAAMIAAILLGLFAITWFVMDAFGDPIVRAGANAGRSASQGGQSRQADSLIHDTTRLAPGPCGPQFPGPLNPC